MKNRPNTTQRSWSNYEGSNPIKAWLYKDPVDNEARFYADSPLYAPGATRPAPPEPTPQQPSAPQPLSQLEQWKALQRKSTESRLQRAQKSFSPAPSFNENFGSFTV